MKVEKAENLKFKINAYLYKILTSIQYLKKNPYFSTSYGVSQLKMSNFKLIIVFEKKIVFFFQL